MSHIGYEDAVLLLKQIVADRGEDWIYPPFDACPDCSAAVTQHGDYGYYCGWHMEEGCRYFTYGGAPACIVGEFIHRTVDLSNYDGINIEGRIASEAIDHLSIEVDDRTRRLLAIAQQRQDEGIPWGEALTRAIEATNTFTE